MITRCFLIACVALAIPVAAQDLPRFSLVPATVDENDSPAEIEIFIESANDDPIRFRISTADGTAKAGEDYVAVTAKRIEATTFTKIRIVILDDNVAEPVETFYVDVVDADNAVALTTRVAVTIHDDGMLRAPQIGSGSTKEGDHESKTVMVYLTMREAIGLPFSLRLFSTPVTANRFLDYKSVDTMVTFREGQTTVAVPITIYGDSEHEADETFRLELEGTGSTAIFTIIDDDEPNSLPGVSIDEADVIEGTLTTTLMRFRVSLTAPSFDGVNVTYETEERDADAGDDFTSRFGIVRFQPGELVKWIEIEVTADDVEEWYWQFFTVRLLEADGANIERSFASGRIRDDDEAGLRWLKVHDAVAFEGSTAIFRLELTRPADQPITVRWAAAETLEFSLPKATVFRDFQQQISAITFQPGETLKEIAVKVAADSEVEKDEYFGLFVAPGNGYEFDPRPGTGVIIDTDREWGWPQLRVEDRRVVEGDNWTDAHFTLVLSRASETEASVVVATREAGELDFESLNTTVTFAPGETEKTVVLRVRGDDVAESPELVTLGLREPSGLIIARDFAIITIVDDDRTPRDRSVRH